MRLPRSLLAVLIITVSPASLAQQPGSMDESQLQGMMQGMAQMAACMQNIDQDRLNALAEEGKAVHEDVKALCAAGKRDEAQARTMEFAHEFTRSPEFKQLQECGEMAKQMVGNMPDYARYADSEEGEIKHVCDDL